MLFNIYLGSLVFSWVILKLGSKAMEDKLKREGYALVEKKTVVEKIFGTIRTVIKGSIPILNLITAGYLT